MGGSEILGVLYTDRQWTSYDRVVRDEGGGGLSNKGWVGEAVSTP